MSGQTPPIIVTGMHRSGTSLVSNLLGDAGVDMGPGKRTGKKYFEDHAFVDLHRKMLDVCLPREVPGMADWGWTEGGSFDNTGATRFVDQARALTRKRERGRGEHWGWKDPRTTLFLEFWDELIPDARYLLLYRFPWEVADSMQRLGADVFLDNPEYAHSIWRFYNERILAFANRHSDRCLLVSVNGLRHRFEEFRVLVEQKLGITLAGSLPDRATGRDSFFSPPERDPLVELVAEASPESIRILRQLDHAADLPATGLWHDGTPRPLRLVHRPEKAGDVITSIVIACFNHGEFLLEAVASAERSVPAETTELIIVNDGSDQPRTLEVLAALRRSGYRIIDQEQGGLSRARNNGIEAATGRYILPLDADNRLLSGYVQKGNHILDRSPEIGIVYGSRRNFGMRDQVVHPPLPRFPEICYHNRVDACALFRRQVWIDCAGYDESLETLEDWELWLHALVLGWRFHHLQEVLFEYRVRPNSKVRATAKAGGSRATIRYVHAKHAEALKPYLAAGTEGPLAPFHRLIRRLRREWIRRTHRSRGVRS